MSYKATLVCSLFAVALCLFNATGYDPHNLFLFMLSVPIWFVELFGDIHQVNVLFMYVLTVASWAIIGYCCDVGIARVQRRRSAA
ncbi:hypothetical protein [Cohnella thailandensis]|jgi:hypothetical protein|uniref:Uncharacterized protein n=1 Tax=Cohnella thailandensis TaxID=557557 RepID=A0A841T3N7_9BACL|nr:hypothetical protein [Cohnella thailandensis]MBB6638232.1 hypothetical protein [Cohnella thailandensis]MBP1977793.1 hypothetical protein [Cohnella thailandensis]